MSLYGVIPLADEDPFVGFAGTTSLFVETTAGQYVVNPAKLRYFNAPQSFTMPKPAGIFRIVVLGGSTTYGRPYQHKTSFGRWLESLIEQYAPGTEVEVLNAGGISYASYRVRRLMVEMADYQPDLFVVYSGHNEFLEARTFADLREESGALRTLRRLAHHSRIYSILARSIGRINKKIAASTTFGDEVAATLERIGGPELYHRDPEFRAGVIRQYRHEMESMVRFCRERKIPLVLATLPVNLSGVSPFKSEHAEQLERDTLKRWQLAYTKGEAALNAGQPDAALAAFDEARALDDSYAELYYRMGQSYDLLGDFKQAYLAYDRAKQEDVVALRALNEFNQIIRVIATAEQVPLADVEKTFVNISPGHIPGNNLFADHVHPTIEGQQLIAWLVLTAAAQAELVPLDNATWQRSMPQAREFLRKALAEIPETYQAFGFWGVGRLYFWAGKYPEAYVALKKAWPYIQDQPEIARQLGELEMMRGDPVAALDFLDAAVKLAPEDIGVAVARASALNRVGRSEEALRLLLTVNIPENEKGAGVYHSLGETLLLLNRPADAAGYFQQAATVAPDVAPYRLALAEAFKRAENRGAAENAYRGYLGLLPNTAVAEPLAEWLEKP